MSNTMTATPLEIAFRTLEEARQTGDSSQLAQALIQHSSTLSQMGYFIEARSAMDEAARLHQQMGNIIDVSMSTQYAARISRLAGDLEGAKTRMAAAMDILPENDPLLVPAYIELGEIAMMAGKGIEAAEHFTTAIDRARALQRSDLDLKHPLDRRARAFMLAGLHEDGLADLETVQRIALAEGNLEAATKFAIDQATLLHIMGRNADSHRRSDDALTWAEETNNNYALADVCLLKAALALDDNNLETALNAALHARHYALEAVVPHFYVAASLALAELYDLLGDRFACYEALAVGYSTLNDLIGEELTKDAFNPKLLEKREQWGAEAFDAVKAEYEAARRKKANKSKKRRSL
jgi:hypothetical protein